MEDRHAYTPNELAQSENAEAYLTVVRNAFSSLNAVLEKSDTDPNDGLCPKESCEIRVLARRGFAPAPQDLTLQKTDINVTLFVLEYLKETFASH